MPVPLSVLLAHRRRHARRIAIVVAAMFLWAPLLFAQGLSSQEPPAHIAVVDGDVTLDREVDQGAADLGMPVVPGDRLRTSLGRTSVLFPDGTSVDLDQYSALDLQSPTLLRLTEGRVRLTVPRDSRARFEVATPAGTVRIDNPGEFRVAVLGTSYAQTELVVVRGVAELEGERDWVRVAAGERSIVWTGDEPGRPERYNVARQDAFDRWSDDQRQGRTAGNSAQYLPPELRMYGGEFDRDGAWQYESTYGYVWYPSVQQDWRPYFSGYWASVPRYGWTWIGLERWAWPTHHYGRWGYAANRWFWIPDRRWATAWVSWESAPGYVSWCPLGWDNRPVFQFSVASSSARAGWLVMPRDRFERREYVHRSAGARSALPPRAGGFTPSGPPPAPAFRQVPPRDRARDREAANGPMRGGAVPRSGAISGQGPDTGSRTPRETYRVPSAVPRTEATTPPDGARRSGSGVAVPRGSTPEAGGPPQRQYPFGDFRRRPDSGTPPPDGGTAASGDSGSAGVRGTGERPRAGERERGAPPPPRTETPPERIYVPPPPSSGTAARPRPGDESSGRGGSIGRAPGAPTAPPGGDRGGDRGNRGTAQPREGNQGSQDRGSHGDSGGSRGDSGRQHDPGSRRPR